MKVLAIAYDCIPGAGSEPGLGWQWTQLAAQRHDVWAMTKASNRRAIESHPDGERVNWVYIDVDEARGPLRTGTSLGDATHMFRWLRQALVEARRLGNAHNFDLVHHVSFGAFWLPSPMVKLDLPYVFGPVTGGEVIPPEFRRLLSFKARASNGRESLQAATMRTPNWRRMARSPKTVRIAATERTRVRMLRAGAADVHLYRPSLSLSAEQLHELDDLDGPQPDDPVRFVSSGRLIGWKGHILAIEAFAQVVASHPTARFDLVGDGSERTAIERRIAELDVGHAVTLHGHIHRNDERRVLARGHVFVFPSLRDSGATLLIFAMALGLPIAGFDTGAARQVIGPETGTLVEPGPRQQSTTRLAEAMNSLACDSSARAEMSEAGRRRVREVFDIGEAAIALERWYGLAAELK